MNQLQRWAAMAAVFALTVLTLAVPEARAADTWEIDKAHSAVEFKIRHLVSKVTGRFGAFEGKLVGSLDDPTSFQVEGTIQAGSIDTNNAKRDAHLKNPDFFDVEKYPTITYKSTKVKKVGEDRYEVVGNLTMHGVTLPVTLTAEFGGVGTDPWGNTKLGLTVSGELDRKAFGLTYNATLDQGGLLLGDKVGLSLEIEANKKK